MDDTAGNPEVRSGVLLPDGQEFVSWETPLQFTKTYYVDNRNPKASDANPGTKDLPFLTINKAAEVLQPGERWKSSKAFIASASCRGTAAKAPRRSSATRRAGRRW